MGLPIVLLSANVECDAGSHTYLFLLSLRLSWLYRHIYLPVIPWLLRNTGGYSSNLFCLSVFLNTEKNTKNYENITGISTKNMV